MKIAAFCGLTVLALAGCSSTPPDTREADAKALKDLEVKWNQDFAAKDAAKLTAHYADDAVLINPGAPAISGKDAIGRALTGMVSDPALSLKFQTSKAEVSKSGDLGYTQGSYSITMTDPGSKQVINDRGSYATTYRKQADGSWKAVVDIASSEAAPPAPKATPPPAHHKKKKK